MRDRFKVLKFIPNKPLQTNKQTKNEQSILEQMAKYNLAGYGRMKPLPRSVPKVKGGLFSFSP